MHSLLRRFRLPALLLAMALAAFACAAPPVVAPPVAAPQRAGEIADLRNLPQDLNAYLSPATADKPLVPPGEKDALVASFRQAWLKPWTMDKPEYKRRDIEDIFLRYEKSPGFDAKGQPRTPRWAGNLNFAADLKTYPHLVRKALTVKNTSLRGMPTNEPRFADPSLPGEGYPFDYLQHTALPPGTPLLVTHVTRDGTWVLAEAGLTFGWLPASDVASVDEATIREISASPLAAVIKDKTEAREVSLTVGVGAVFPLAASDGGATVLVPSRGPGGAAVLNRVRLPSGSVTPLPMTFTPRNVASVGNQFMGQAYGWGGIDGLRDCSAMTHDLFVPFGLYLPRNSSTQAASGAAIDLGDLAPGQKEQLILDQGTPFATLIWLKGHIMVYVGRSQNHPVVLQDIWGLRTFGENGRDGRLVLGRVVVTTLRAGEEIPAVGPEHILLNRIRSMVLLAR